MRALPMRVCDVSGLRALVFTEQMITGVIKNAVVNAAHGDRRLSRQRLDRAIVHAKLLVHSLEVARLQNDRRLQEDEAAPPIDASIEDIGAALRRTIQEHA